MKPPLRHLSDALAKHIVEQRLGLPIGPSAEIALRPDGDRLLPPWLGEFGIEVSFFLALVEPWLRSGWRIPAKRPELYPSGTTVDEPEMFAEIAVLRRRFGGVERMARIALPRPSVYRGAFFDADPASRSKGTLRLEMDNLDALETIERFERELRSIVFPRIAARARPKTFWDAYLTSCHDPTNEPFLEVAKAILVPSYLPESFLSTASSRFGPHVGCQLRLVPEKPERDANVARIVSAAQHAQRRLNLPIVFYGPDSGTIAPAGALKSRDFARPGERLLGCELELLRDCRLMVCALTAITSVCDWLRIPTLAEGPQKYLLEAHRAWHPRVDWIPDSVEGLDAAIDRVIGLPEHLPDPEAGILDALYAPSIAYLRPYVGEVE